MESFLQSTAWSNFQKSLGRKVWEIDSINVIKYDLPLGKSYLYAPRCGKNFLSKSFLKKIRKITKNENTIFFKIEPLRQVQCKPFIKSTNIQPSKTLILDIKKPEKELLKQMCSKTRYNIRLAGRKGVKIKKSERKKDFESFWKLLQQTTKRDKFSSHEKEYYEKILDIPGAKLFIAERPSSSRTSKNKIIAANIVLFYKETAIYLHGASDYKYRSLMAPYLLQWEQIKEAKKRGCVEYDFWGIDKKKWPGVTRFKKGFCPKARKESSGPSSKSYRGGEEVNYPGAYDLIFQPIWYKLYKIAKKVL